MNTKMTICAKKYGRLTGDLLAYLTKCWARQGRGPVSLDMAKASDRVCRQSVIEFLQVDRQLSLGAASRSLSTVFAPNTCP